MHFCYPYGMIGLMIGGIGMIGMMHFTDHGMIHDMRYTAVGGWWFEGTGLTARSRTRSGGGCRRRAVGGKRRVGAATIAADTTGTGILPGRRPRCCS